MDMMEIRRQILMQPERVPVEWNQLVKNGNFNNTDYWIRSRTTASDTMTVSGNTLIWTCKEATSYAYQSGARTNNQDFNIPYNHRTLGMARVRCSISERIRFYAMSGSTNGLNYATPSAIPANEWVDVIGAISASTDPNYTITRFKICLGGPVAVGTTLEIQRAMFFDRTQMFGAGNEPTAVQFRALCGKNGIDLDTWQEYDGGTQRYWVMQ